MSANTSKARPKGQAAKAARAETETPKKKTLKWGGLTLELPEQLPRTVMYDITMASADGDNALPMYLMLQSIVGDEQFLQIRNKLSQDEKLDDGDLLNKALEQYGISLGESQASADS